MQASPPTSAPAADRVVRRLAGMDLGGRTTAKTALAVLDVAESGAPAITVYDTLQVAAICQNRDDYFLDWLRSLELDLLAVDAPLSLPDFRHGDYLLRPSDRLVGALSPMSLGEITARALHLSFNLPEPYWIEVYPKTVLAYFGLPTAKYKNDPLRLATILEHVQRHYQWRLPDFPLTGDNVDAVLALVAAYHFAAGAYKDIAEPGAPPFSIPVFRPVAEPA